VLFHYIIVDFQPKKMTSILGSFRQTWLRRNTIFLATVFGGALLAELVVDSGVDRFWEWRNRGKLWKDVEKNLLTQNDDSEE
jgi:ubiquinol-cytochrome c reductase subunit 9